jgi:glutamate-1-semialdehyde 2,1-aminomutase
MAPADADSFVRDEDRRFFEQELDSFVPDSVFDAHCHIWNDTHTDVSGLRDNPQGLPAEVGYEEYVRLSDCLHPGRGDGALFIPFPFDPARRDDGHRWISRQASMDARCRALFWVYPDDDPEWVRQEVQSLGLRGLKPYHMSRDGKPSWQAEIPEYLPEPLVKMAHQEGWVIMLHLVRTRAVADASNIHWIHTYCKRYPNMKLVLAHAARGFHPSHNLEGLGQLTGLGNLYCDTSANCEPMAHATIIRTLGHRRLLYGSDFCVSHMRGRNFAVGDLFVWVCEDRPVWNDLHASVKPILIGLESIAALKWACWSERMTDSQVEDIFRNNAVEAYGID